MSDFSKGAELLLQARLTRQRLPKLPDDCYPGSLSAAYELQDALTAALLNQFGGRQIGYKIACTNTAAQAFLGLDGPFYGPLLSYQTQPSPARFNSDSLFMNVIEPEFAFEMARDLPPQTGDFSREQVAEAVWAILPAIEIVDSRYVDWTTIGARSLIADQAAHGAWIRGQVTTAWREFDLLTHQVELRVNGQVNQTGNGSVVLGHPLKALTWLANALNRRGRGLEAGQVITTGVCIDQVYPAQAGDEVVADFGPLGLIEIVLKSDNLPGS